MFYPRVHLQADSYNFLLRRVNLTSGRVTTLAGNTSGIVGRNNWGHADGMGTLASFYYIFGVAADGAGVVAVVVRYSCRIEGRDRISGSVV